MSRKSSWSILVEGLRIKVFIGVPDEERRIPQTLFLDLCCDLSFIDPTEDELLSTVDYAEVVRLVQRVCLGKPRKLLECLAQDLVSELFQFDPRIIRCRLSLRKPKKLPGLDALGVVLDVRRTHRRRGPVRAKQPVGKSPLKNG